MARMFNPPHPGLTLRDDVLPALGLNVTEAAQQLGMSRVALSRVLNGRAAISPEMALRIEAWLGVARGGEARLWLAEQSAYDVWQAARKFKAQPMRVQPAQEVKPMALTRNFKETVIQRVQSDSNFAQALLDEAATLFLNGEPETARLILP